LAFLIQKSKCFMKKVKLMLTSIAILSILGGVFAFKAATLSHPIWTTPNAQGNCTIQEDGFVLTTTSSSAKIEVTNVASAPCVLTYTKGQAD
jgi:hypothetical protein